MNKYHSIEEYEEYTRSYDVRYVAEIKHLGLDKIRVLKDLSHYILKSKIRSQFKTWDEQWEKQETRRVKEEDREINSAAATDRTTEAREALIQLENVLSDTLLVDDAIDWSSLKDLSAFIDANPKLILNKDLASVPKPVKKSEIPYPPAIDLADFEPKLGFFDKIVASRKNKKLDTATAAFKEANDNWNTICKGIDRQNDQFIKEFEQATEEYSKIIDQIKTQYDKLEVGWKEDEKKFYKDQEENNSQVDELREKYMSQDEEAVLHYCEMVLNNSNYPDFFPKDFQLDYNADNKILLVEYILPRLESFPTLKEVKYIASRNELKETHISELQKAKLYDDVIYKIALRTIHELFEADRADALTAVVFNGWVDTINKSTGNLVTNCIISLKADKTEFEQINLSLVDPKSCFKSLKGVGSSKLSGLVAIQPILQMDKNDKRFVNSYSVIEDIGGENLATMAWEDFEHLIREVFEKEFSSNSGEVKVTQASRDGGVDAIAFDPDPIRGGKIVIQAKRYSNTVGVSAVRDLYGTVMNEGATKGILVTTADYGPDAYTFAQNKPITLLNGSNLLHLLERHGHSARIDLKEAKDSGKNI